MDLAALIAKAKAEQQQAEPFTLDVLVAGELVTVKGWPMEGTRWVEFTAVHPPRAGVAQDANAGYNVHGVIPDYPFKRVEGDRDVDFAEGEWADLVSVLKGPDLNALGALIWSANVNEPVKARREAGKASKGVQPRKRRSPAS